MFLFRANSVKCVSVLPQHSDSLVPNSVWLGFVQFTFSLTYKMEISQSVDILQHLWESSILGGLLQ